MAVKTVNDRIFEANLKHSIYLQRHSASVVQQMVALLNKSEAGIISRLEREDFTNLSKARQEKLLQRIRDLIKDGYKPVTRALAQEVRDLSIYEAGFQANLFSRVVPIAFDVITPSPKQVAAAVKTRPFNGRLLREWYSDLPKGAFRRMKDAIRIGAIEGRTTEQVIRDIRGTRKNRYTDGIIQRSRHSIASSVRTALNHSANSAREMTYAENSDLVKGVQWVATLDGRTTLICASRDGKIYEVGKGPRPPAHIGCRSTTTPVLKSLADLGLKLKDFPEATRASMNGQLPSSTTYNSFLKAQPRDFQDSVLGKKRGILYRKGEFDLNKYEDKRGSEMSLSELKVKERARPTIKV